MLSCNEKHKIILTTSNLGWTRTAHCPAKIVHTVSTFINPRDANGSEKFKRDFESGKYTFAHLKLSRVDQTRRRKAGLVRRSLVLSAIWYELLRRRTQFTPFRLSARSCHETYLLLILITHEAFTIPF
jgi:hypothetical protein